MHAEPMDLDDVRWGRLKGGYRTFYDPRNALRELERGADAAWQELWNELHHQADVGDASYAAVPHLVRIYESRRVPDWNTYGLVAVIEDARQRGHNPDFPPGFREPYEAAWRRLVELGLLELRDATEPSLASWIIAVVAIGKGQLALGRFAGMFDEGERKEVLAASGWQ